MILFKDRRDGGHQLAQQLLKYKGQKDTIVLGLARGGVVVAAEVATALHLPLNVIVVRKIGAPNNEELAVGAIAEHGEGIFNDHLIALIGVSSEYLQREIERQKKILQERLILYRGSASPLELKGKMVILVDDGLATGASMRAAIESVRSAAVKKIILAVPVAAPDSLDQMRRDVDEVVCLSSPPSFQAVGSFYRVFDATSDSEIVQLLQSCQM
jgi:putative phosphoribosyl transferase